jgi:hypothetical protein
VRDLLGHASVTTTERYDNQTLANLKIAAARLERGHPFAHAARAKFQEFQNRGLRHGLTRTSRDPD